MPIVIAQPSPVGAAGAVGRAQGLAGAQGQALQAQLAAAQLYSQHAARMASIEQQGAGQVTAANVAGAGMAERAFEAGLDFDSQRLRAQDRQAEIQSQVAGQLMLQNQELTQKENLRLQRLKTAIADVGADVQAGKITPQEGQEIMGQLKYQVSGLEMRKARAIAQSQELQVQEQQRQAGLFSAMKNANAQGSAMMWDNFKVGVNPVTRDYAGWINPFDGKFIEKPKPETPDHKPFDAVKAKNDAQAEADIAYPPTVDEISGKEVRSAENTRYAADLWRQRRAEHEAIFGSPQTGRATPPTEKPAAAEPKSEVPEAQVQQIGQDRRLIESAKNLAHKEGHLQDLAWAEQSLKQYGGAAQMPDDVLERYVKIRENMDQIRNLGSSLVR